MSPLFVTAKDLALRYTLHPKTVWKYARCGILPSTRVAKRCIRFNLALCDEVLRKRSGSISLPLIASLGATCLLPFILAIAATECQHFTPSEVAQSIPKLLVGRSTRPGTRRIFRLKVLVAKWVRLFWSVDAWEFVGAQVCS